MEELEEAKKNEKEAGVQVQKELVETKAEEQARLDAMR